MADIMPIRRKTLSNQSILICLYIMKDIVIILKLLRVVASLFDVLRCLLLILYIRRRKEDNS